MNNEIKEILDNPKILILSYGSYISIDDYCKIKDCITNLQEKYDIAQKDIEILTSNYNDLVKMSENKITNLQEEVNKLTAESTEWESKCYDLQEENERLKENAIHNDKVVDKAKWNEMLYKSRNEKAKEYIYKLQKDDDIEIWRENGYWAYVLNILQGDDKQ